VPRPVRLVFLLALLALAAPAAARQPRTLVLRFPRFTLPPGANRELCVFVRLPGTAPVDVASWKITHHAARGMGVRHFLVYAYGGERFADFAAQAGRLVESRGCLDLGPIDRDRRQLIASGASIRSRILYPSGVALRLAPVPDAPGGVPAGIGLLLDANWVNGSSRTRAASTRMVLRRPVRRSVRRLAVPFGSRTPERGLSVPPGELRSTEDSTAARPATPDVWQPAADACVLLVSGQMHEHGRLVAVDRLGTDGLPRNPADGPLDPFESGRRHLFAATDYTDPGSLGATPLLVRAGEALHPLCWHDNGVERSVRLGCEETPGVVPGAAAGLGGAPAKPCTVVRSGSPECPPGDPAYPTRSFTGACVLANLVAGDAPDDEVCGLTGVVYDAVPGASDAAGCDVSALPPLP
jgi:hypothetical protein